MRRTWLSIYLFVTVGLLVMGFIFEEPYSDRRVILLVLMVAYIGVLTASLLLTGRHWVTLVLSVLMVGLLLFIEFYSKYAVNYFLHTLYIMLIFFNITQIESRRAVGISAFVTLLSFVKFIQLIFIDSTFANVALMVFFGSVQVLVVVVGIFLKVYQEETQKTKGLYGELLETHNQLKLYADEIKDLSQMEARTMIARDLHDTLGHDLTGLIMQMEMAGDYYDQKEFKEGQRLLEASKKSARESLVNVRKIVETLKSSNESTVEQASIGGLIQEFSQRTGCRIDFTHRGTKTLKPERRIVLYRIVQESLTNAVRHGKATLIKVTLIYGSEGVSFEVEDNGIGCSNIVYSNGIRGMKERLVEVGGDIIIQGEPSFKLWGSMPYEEVV